MDELKLAGWLLHRAQTAQPRSKTDKVVKPALAAVLQEMNEEDTAFTVELVILAGDLSAAYDGFHSQNRNARSGVGNFCSHAMGLVLLLTVLDKYRSAGISVKSTFCLQTLD